MISRQTSDQMRKLLRLVVQYGTGEMVDAPGYVVGGKTGTADKVEGRHYAEQKLLSSFVGVFPMTAPKYLVMAMVDEPHPNKASHGYATAGWTAAPAVGPHHRAHRAAARRAAGRRILARNRRAR